MSYDLQVYAQQALEPRDLRQLVDQAGLGVAGDTSDALTVVRGARGRYSFTLGKPAALEPEDVPEEVTAVLLSPSFLYELLVEGSAASETPHAVRFARRLAEASGGMVLDQQTGSTWSRGKLRTCAPVEGGRIDIVEVHWYTKADHSADRAATVWLEVARKFLPEALPRRFGTYEPLKLNLQSDGSDAFVRTVAGDEGLVFFKASAPCIGGHLSGAAGVRGIRSHALSVHREPLNDPKWRDSFEKLFVEFAIRTGAFFASAEVERNVGWSGRSTWYDANVERTTYLGAQGRWAGLLPYPAWWTWFGPEYLPLVVDHLPGDQVRAIGNGLFHTRAVEPLDRDQLIARTPAVGVTRRSLRGLLSRDGRAREPEFARAWLPTELQATVDTSDPNQYVPPLTPAVKMPSTLVRGD